MMKRITCTLAVLVVTLVAVRPAGATYVGRLAQGDYTLEVQTTSKVAITILVVTSRGKLDVEEVLLFDGATPPKTFTIQRNVLRIIFEADAQQNSDGLVTITQGTTRFEVPVDPHDNIVADIIQPQ
ncbi:MAG TPA: hypothetical protein VGJ69_11820 [Pyrinomonadaceae bacterium]|jgi:hypothetical protein